MKLYRWCRQIFCLLVSVQMQCIQNLVLYTLLNLLNINKIQAKVQSADSFSKSIMSEEVGAFRRHL